MFYFLFVQCWTQLVERKYDPTGRKGRKGPFPCLRCGGWRGKEEQWGRSSLLWLCCAEWVTAVCTWGGQKGKAEQIRGWLLVNVQVEKKHVNGWMFPKLSLAPAVAEIGPLWATQFSPYSPPNESQCLTGGAQSLLNMDIFLKNVFKMSFSSHARYSVFCHKVHHWWGASNSHFPRMENNVNFYLCCF